MRLALSALLLSAAAQAADDDDIFLQGVGGGDEAANKKPLFVVPLQPVWNSADADLLIKVGKNLVTLIEEGGPWKVQFYDETADMNQAADHEARLHTTWLKEVVYTEALARHRRAAHALKGAARVTRIQSQNAGYLRTPNLYCRALLVTAEAALLLGKTKDADMAARRLAATCERGDLERGRLKPSKRMIELLEAAITAAAADASGAITVSGDVPGADVYLNGRHLGLAPLTIKGLASGDHLVGVFKEGYSPWGTKVRLDSGQEKTLKATVTRGMGGRDQQEMMTALRDNRAEANVARVAAKLVKKHANGAPFGLFGGVAEYKDKIWVTLYAVDARGRAQRLKQMTFEKDFLTAHLTLSPVMKSLDTLAIRFEGTLLRQRPLLDGIKKIERKPRSLMWRIMRSKNAAKEAAVEAPEEEARGPIARGPRKGPVNPADAAKEAARRKNADTSGAPLLAKRKKDGGKAEPGSKETAATEAKPAEGKPAAADDEEEAKIAAEMEAKALEEAAKATGLSVQALEELAQREMQKRIWDAIDGDFAVEASALGALGLSRSTGGGALQLTALRRQPSPIVGLWMAGGLEAALGTTSAGLDDPDFDDLAYPRLETTAADPQLMERIRFAGGASWALRAIGRLEQDVIAGGLRAQAQLSLGVASFAGKLVNEQLTRDADGKAVESSALDLEESVAFSFRGMEVGFGLGASMPTPIAGWRTHLRAQYQTTFLGNVISFVEGTGVQEGLGLVLGLSGTF